MISEYETAGTKIGPEEAVKVGAAVVEKGGGTDEDICKRELYLEVSPYL